MAGFFGLFGKKTKYVDETDNGIGEEAENKEAFFLQPDDAKSFGNIEFMRKPNTIQRSFPKTLKGKGAKVIRQVSSIETNGNGAIEAVNFAKPDSKAEIPVNSDRRSTDTNLDMYRKMARDLKK